MLKRTRLWTRCLRDGIISSFRVTVSVWLLNLLTLFIGTWFTEVCLRWDFVADLQQCGASLHFWISPNVLEQAKLLTEHLSWRSRTSSLSVQLAAVRCVEAEGDGAQHAALGRARTECMSGAKVGSKIYSWPRDFFHSEASLRIGTNQRFRNFLSELCLSINCSVKLIRPLPQSGIRRRALPLLINYAVCYCQQ